MQSKFETNLNENSFNNAFYFVSRWGTRELTRDRLQYAEDGPLLVEVV